MHQLQHKTYINTQCIASQQVLQTSIVPMRDKASRCRKPCTSLFKALRTASAAVSACNLFDETWLVVLLASLKPSLARLAASLYT